MNAIFLLLADVLLILAGVIYGVKFLRKLICAGLNGSSWPSRSVA